MSNQQDRKGIPFKYFVCNLGCIFKVQSRLYCLHIKYTYINKSLISFGTFTHIDCIRVGLLGRMSQSCNCIYELIIQAIAQIQTTEIKTKHKPRETTHISHHPPLCDITHPLCDITHLGPTGPTQFTPGPVEPHQGSKHPKSRNLAYRRTSLDNIIFRRFFKKLMT